MNIGFDLTWISSDNQWGGIYQYAVRLVSSLARHTDHTIISFVSEGSESLFDHLKGVNNFKLLIHRHGTPLAAIIEQENIEVIHTPMQYHHNFTLAVPMITTLHDLQPFYFPEFFTPEDINFRNIYYRKSAEFSERVIVSYQHVKDDLVKFYNIPSDKIDICGHGMAAVERIPVARIAELKKQYNLPERYLFYSANTWRHKNHIGLVHAIKALRDKHGVEILLICTGIQYPDYFPTILKAIDDSGLNDKVRFLGYLPEEEKNGILCGATLSVVPTLYEAGSYPLMEAMIFGVPVICATTTSLPDAIGDPRFLFDPNSPEDMARKIALMLTDSQLREDNIANSRDRVLDWRWENAVKPYVASYRRAITDFEKKQKTQWYHDWAVNFEFFMSQSISPVDVDAKVQAIHQSISWRLTAPVRWLFGKLKSE